MTVAIQCSIITIVVSNWRGPINSKHLHYSNNSRDSIRGVLTHG